MAVSLLLANPNVTGYDAMCGAARSGPWERGGEAREVVGTEEGVRDGRTDGRTEGEAYVHTDWETMGLIMGGKETQR